MSLTKSDFDALKSLVGGAIDEKFTTLEDRVGATIDEKFTTLENHLEVSIGEKFDVLKDLMEVTIDEKLEVKLDQKLDEKLKYLPTRDEFYESQDRVMSELKDIREELTVLNARTIDHSDRLENLEKIHPHGHHVALAS